MKLINKWLLWAVIPFSVMAVEKLQVKPIVINQALIEKIQKIQPDSSNANSLEKLLGPPSASLPIGNESWVCQWKGNLSSNRIENTLNITFEAGMIAKIVGIDKKGVLLVTR